jgi:hypothetical protein
LPKILAKFVPEHLSHGLWGSATIISLALHHYGALQQIFAARWCASILRRPSTGTARHEESKISPNTPLVPNASFTSFPNEKFPVMAIACVRGESRLKILLVSRYLT